MIGISIKPTIGIGDGIQFSSLPENYYIATGKKLYDVNKPWFFDHNPFVTRELTESLEKTVELWNFPTKWEWPRVRAHGVYLNNAEIFAALFGIKAPTLNRPRLYKYENFAYENRSLILLQTIGKSHGTMPDAVVEHVVKKYRATKQLYHIGPIDSRVTEMGLERLVTPTLWDLAMIVSQARMVIGLDSGPAWVAAAYPDVIVKKLRMRPSVDVLKTWVPLAIDNVHSHWDDRCHQIYNPSEYDIGFTSSFRKI